MGRTLEHLRIQKKTLKKMFRRMGKCRDLGKYSITAKQWKAPWRLVIMNFKWICQPATAMPVGKG